MYHTWRNASRSIRLRLSVMNAIQGEVMEGFTAVPRRGAEVGGILLGRMHDNGQEVTIEDFEPAPCEHRFGPSYHLSPDDVRNFEETLEWFRPGPHRDLSVVGFYRSHTRYGFFLSEEDQKLLSKYFPEPASVFLLIKPLRVQSSVAGFFFWEGGRLREDGALAAFPFGLPPVEEEPWIAVPSDAVVETPAPVVAAPEPEPAPPPAPPAPELPPPFRLTPAFAQRAPRSRANWVWPVLTVIMVIAGAVLGYESLGDGLTGKAEIRSPAGFGLKAERDRGRVVVRWNGDSKPVLDAQRAILKIIDGERRRDLQLTPEQLRTGRLLYVPKNGDLAFQMNIFNGVGAASSESVRLQVPQTSPLPPEPLPATADQHTRSRMENEAGRVNEAEVRSFLARWIESLRRGDADAYIDCYAPELSVYFTKKEVTRATVRQSVEQMLSRYGKLDVYRISEVRIEPGGSDRAIATFRKHWQTSGRRKFAGEERERLTLVRTAGRWQIAAEEELKLYWVHKAR